MIIHATVTITGDASLRAACEARLRRLLSQEFLRSEVTEHHGRDALCYDLKIEGGIPFPVFAEASGEFAALEFRAEWVNLDVGEKRSASIVGGKLAEQESEHIATRAGEARPVHVEVAPDGRLVLALTLFRAGRGEWRGYALTATRDAAIRVLHATDSGAVELLATDGAPEWVTVWHGDSPSGPFVRGELRPPVGIDEPVFRELDALARGFAADWMWFSGGSQEDTAVESARYARAGYTVAAANIRTSKLHLMRAGGADGQLVYSSLEAEERRIRDIVAATWAVEGDS